MSLISRLLSVVRAWRGPRVAKKPARRTVAAMEQLDHRQLLAVNFTGNVAIDFPATMQPGVVVIPDNPNVTHPNINPASLQPIIKVSGLDINGIRATYDPTDDTLSIGLEQPLNQKPELFGQQFPVIAGDIDNNGDAGTVAPETIANAPGNSFTDNPDLQGFEGLGAFLDFTGTGLADVIAGFDPLPDNPTALKLYQVVRPGVNPGTTPGIGQVTNFGTPLPGNTGNVYLNNSPLHPNLEFTITNFSQLYRDTTGRDLTAATNIGIGAFGASSNSIAVSSAFFPSFPINIGQATKPPPVTPPDCPPLSPPIVVNPHTGKVIDSAHRSDVRVTVFGSSGLPVDQINSATVLLNGVSPTRDFTRTILRNGFKERTFIFPGMAFNNLPPGKTVVTLTGRTFQNVEFNTSVIVTNRNDSFYSPAQVAARDRRLARSGDAMAASLVADGSSTLASKVDAVAAQAAQASQAAASPLTVAIPTRAKAKGAKQAAAKVPTMSSASAFRRANHLKVNAGKSAAAPTASQGLAAQDAAIAALASSHGDMAMSAA